MTESLAGPVTLEHWIVKVVGLEETGTDSVPEIAFGPAHAPLKAMQLSAFVEFHESVVFCGRDCPEERMIWSGDAVRETIGGWGWGLTVTMTDDDAVPPVPVQERAYVVVAVRLPVDSVPPDALFVPLQPFDAVQEVALETVHVRVEAVL